MGIRTKLESVVVLTLAVLALCMVLPLIVLVFAVGLLWRESRVAVGVGLYLLVVTAIGLAVGRESIAEQLAICAYTLLAVGTAMLSIRLVGDYFRKTVSTE